VDVSEPASISTGIAARYAQAVFDIASEEGTLDKLETDVDALAAALGESADLRALLVSPMISRGEQEGAITALARAMDLSDMLTNTLALMATKRRLFVVPQMVAALRARLAERRGEVTAEVRAAKALTKAQSTALSAALKEASGKDVTLDVTVDASLIGGMVVKLGSQMIDTSVRAKLNAMQNTMKEAR
jgi:F-type H+-transporting ATPase subunit delta